MHHNNGECVNFYLTLIQLFALYNAGLIKNSENTILGKTDLGNLKSQIRVVDESTFSLESKGEPKVYFPISFLVQANQLNQKFINRNVYLSPSMGFRIAKVTYDKFEYGNFDETDYSRTFNFYIDDNPEPLYMAYQYTKNGTIFIFRNVGQTKVNFALKPYVCVLTPNFRICSRKNTMMVTSDVYKGI